MLAREYPTPESCQLSFHGTYKSSWKDKILAATENDIDSKLGTYYRLEGFVPRPQVILETERIWLQDIEWDLIHFRLSWTDTITFTFD